MNPIKAFRLYRLADQGESILKEKAPMKVKIPQLVHLAATASALVGVPTFLHAWLIQPEHAAIFAAVTGVSLVLHVIAPSIFGGPSDADVEASGLNKLGVLLALFVLAGLSARAQTTTDAPAGLQNLYAAGVAWNQTATPQVAGNALYAHAIAGTSTYAFTDLDALPSSLKPFTVTTNVGAGVAQKVATLGGVPIFMPTAIGVSWTGNNTGWQWNAGALAVIHLKGKCANCYLLPNVRFLKSSVGGGGYQPILGVDFGWGK